MEANHDSDCGRFAGEHFYNQNIGGASRFSDRFCVGREEALKKTLKNSYALIILDVQMPGMDGFEVAGNRIP